MMALEQRNPNESVGIQLLITKKQAFMKTNSAMKKVAVTLAVTSLVALSASAIVAIDTTQVTTPTAGSAGTLISSGTVNIGEKFQVVDPAGVIVNQLGAFNANRNGWGSETITVILYQVFTASPAIALASQTFNSSSPGAFITGPNSQYAFKTVPNLTLVSDPSITYMLVANGLGSARNPYYNNSSTKWAQSIVSSAFDTAGDIGWDNFNYHTVMPPTENPINAHGELALFGDNFKYGFASLTYSVVPESRAFAMGGAGVLPLVFLGRRTVVSRAV